MIHQLLIKIYPWLCPVEFTPQAFLGPDLDLFFRNFSPSLVGVRPANVLIDGGEDDCMSKNTLDADTLV